MMTDTSGVDGAGTTGSNTSAEASSGGAAAAIPTAAPTPPQGSLADLTAMLSLAIKDGSPSLATTMLIDGCWVGVNLTRAA